MILLTRDASVIICLLVSVASAIPKCGLPAKGTQCCYHHEEWRMNLMCRTIGPVHTSGKGRDATGYIKDTELNSWDTPYQVYVKSTARSLFEQMNRDLVHPHVGDSFYALRRLAYYEERVFRIGQLMYGVNWHPHPGMCGVVDQYTNVHSGKKCKCGDKGGDLGFITECVVEVSGSSVSGSSSVIVKPGKGDKGSLIPPAEPGPPNIIPISVSDTRGNYSHPTDSPPIFDSDDEIKNIFPLLFL